ncbi:binding-protein-dependent transport systems inner membrane component [Pseudodesulfovibrio mercurii]|uniref:Binding-protein-dependent transport systems inner membrane component n=1 Tax=Pseudodesulfovibrio mercurii TaxID=641491 RepID=F0JD60_9BACT|nr:ABC transporter permease [Pseudodesulfovibrio mercurii]EGB14552.1 binding-protein-dependent transport systems inner membrane component [Pseudodesulfovibrio mercurii]
MSLKRIDRVRQLTLLALTGPNVLFLAFFCVAPLAVLFSYSFFQVDFVAIVRDPTLANYGRVLESSTYRGLVVKALVYGIGIAALCSVIAYPLAFFIAKKVKVYKAALLTLLLIPLYTGDLIRIFAWRVVLGAEGVLNSLLMWLGIIKEPIWVLLFSPFSTVVVLTYNYLPFMVLPLWAALEAMDNSYLEAAMDLGCRHMATFFKVVLPLTGAGLIAGFMMVFVLVVGDYLTPQLIGGSSGVTVTSAIHDMFGAAFDWPTGSALAWVLLTAMAAFITATVYLFYKSPWGRGIRGAK